MSFDEKPVLSTLTFSSNILSFSSLSLFVIIYLTSGSVISKMSNLMALPIEYNISLFKVVLLPTHMYYNSWFYFPVKQCQAIHYLTLCAPNMYQCKSHAKMWVCSIRLQSLEHFYCNAVRQRPCFIISLCLASKYYID